MKLLPLLILIWSPVAVQSQTVIFLGGCVEISPAFGGSSESIIVYMGGDSHTGRCVYEHKNGTMVKYNIARDYLGNVIGISGSDGSNKAEYSYDPWGRFRNPATHAVYAPGDEPAVMFSRGFGSHLWLPEFGLTHMEARLYDPVLGRFLSPIPMCSLLTLRRTSTATPIALIIP